MSNEETSHILYLKEQVLRFASAYDHKHTKDDITDINDTYAPKKHDSNSTEHGVGTDTKYGHLKLNTDIDENSDNNMPVSVNGIKTYITNQINDLIINLRGELQEKMNINRTVNSSSSHTTNGKDNIPTTKAVWDALVSYEQILEGVDLAQPEEINQDINQIREPGYYIQKGTRTFTYGGERIHYSNALIEVRKQTGAHANRVIQKVYATSPLTSSEGTIYKINGSIYTRWGTSETDWGAWHVVHKPYTKTSRVKSLGTGIDAGAVTVEENTAGFIIHWDQHNSNNDAYPVRANLYEYATVCTFEPQLPIKGPYVFGNLIGRMDVKITPDKMQVRSTVSKGGRIIEVHETYFVPRNQ